MAQTLAPPHTDEKPPKPEGWHPEASYHFVDHVAAAIAKAKELAGDVVRQATSAAWRWVSSTRWPMDVVPVVFGSGKRYFGSVASQHLLDDPDVVIRGDRVLHLRYRLRR